MRHPFRTLFVCWLTVVATGAVVSHCHAAAPEHVHGFGWAACPASNAPTGLPLNHRHFVLLGVEFGAVPPGDGEGDSSEDHVAPVSDLTTAIDDAGLPTVDADTSPLPCILAFSLQAPRPALRPACQPAQLCPFTSRACSGVLRS